MNSIKRTARLAGFLYLILVVTGLFALAFVRPQLIVAGDAAATAANILASQTLYRAGILSELIMYVSFLFMAFPLYALFKPVNKTITSLLVVLILASIPLGMLNTLNNVAAVSLLSGDDYLSAFTTEQLQAQMMHYLNLYDSGYLIAQVFFGAWLLPLGYLAFKSGYFPRILGILLMLGGTSLLLNTITGILAPGYTNIILQVLDIFALSEILFCLWLVFVGANEKSALQGEPAYSAG